MSIVFEKLFLLSVNEKNRNDFTEIPHKRFSFSFVYLSDDKTMPCFVTILMTRWLTIYIFCFRVLKCRCQQEVKVAIAKQRDQNRKSLN